MKQLLFSARIASIVGALAVAGGAYAGTDTITFNVTITVTSTCDIHTGPTTNMAFGNVASTATAVPATSTLTVNCTSLTPYTVALDNGLHGGAGPVRAMQGSSGTVGYQLYQDSAHSQVWGSTTGVSGNVYAGTGSGAAQGLTVYGLVASANSPAGNYTDTITATVAY
jgi:spore coat protein U-like protein